METKGLKLAPLFDMKTTIATYRAATVLNMFTSSCNNTSLVRKLAIMPDPITAIVIKSVPRNSALILFTR
jgi:hypothetical protein